MSLDTLTIAEMASAPGPCALARVKHDLVVNTTAPVLLEQTRHNIGLGLPELDKNHPVRKGKASQLSLCGSAPSLMANLGKLTGKVMAINAAIPALHEAGIVVDYAMIWDATPEMDRYVCDIPGCEWLIASRVNPKVIEKLLGLGQKVTLWHTATTDPEMMEVLAGRLQVFGGAQGITRGVFLVGALGYRDVHIFGADSSFGSETHIGGSLREENECTCVVEDQAFRTTFWMMAQAESWVEFVLPTLMNAGMKFTVHGNGLLPWAHQCYMRKVHPTLWQRAEKLWSRFT
ncbi:MAG TPA: 6-hydroxymethylpterin diphosphokinase MptE-like protein [Pseudomonadales bacterium]|nr:6-hydroxymethylpterin diphosphokinase MptE-like protein [Pseudomonadales bacterium]